MLPAGQSRRLRQRRQQPTLGGALLAALPEAIQDDVLARLPARDVVRTSALSSEWRRRWESVPGLDVDLNLVGVRSWTTAVGVLERCAAPVRGVRINGVPPRLAGRADGWLRLAAGKNPRSISLELSQTADLPAAALPALFDCNPAVLVELWLGSCALPAPPVGFAGFHALETLDLYRIFFLADNGWWRQVEAMLAAAPGLQELSLKGIVFHIADGSLPDGKWVIEGPNLRRLVLCLNLVGAGPWELGALPKLEYADVCLNDDPSDRDYTKLFSALSNVAKLKINHFGGATLQGPIILESLSLGIFEKLRVLKLDTNFCVLSTYISTYYLLSRAPLLQVLEITDYIRDGEINEVNLVAGCMHTTLGYSTSLHKLEYLRMIGISCSENDMYFIKYALHKARYLEKVSVEIFERSQKSCQEVYRELNECPRASAAKIIIKHGDFVCNV